MTEDKYRSAETGQYVSKSEAAADPAHTIAEAGKANGPVNWVLQHFAYSHLPPQLQQVSQHFGVLAVWMAQNLPHNPETTVALRKLLESKDAAVRAAKANPR